MRLVLSAVVVSCALLLGCQSAPQAPRASDKPALAAAAEPINWVRTELFFGLAPAEAEGLGLAAAEGAWRVFLDEVVTPRFPDGFTVLEGRGQWRSDAASRIERDLCRVLVIVHPDTPERREAVDAIRAAYLERTGEESVLAVETPVRPPRF